MKEPWATILIYAWMAGNLAGIYFLGGPFALFMCAGWLLAFVLFIVKDLIAERSTADGRSRGWGQAFVTLGFIHWAGVIVILLDLLKRSRTRPRRSSADDKR